IKRIIKEKIRLLEEHRRHEAELSLINYLKEGLVQLYHLLSIREEFHKFSSELKQDNDKIIQLDKQFQVGYQGFIDTLQSNPQNIDTPFFEAKQACRDIGIDFKKVMSKKKSFTDAEKIYQAVEKKYKNCYKTMSMG